jgi:hypothetical protein
MMEPEFALLRQTRKNCLAIADGLSPRQLEAIPATHNNSILWNLGHLVVSQQLLCYDLAGLPMNIPDGMVKILRKASSPKDWASAPDIAWVKDSLLALPEQTEADYNAGKFGAYDPYPTSYGIELKSIEDAIRFNNLHEALHLGYIMALKRLV